MKFGDYNVRIVIPSWKREDIIKDKTLRLLKNYEVDDNEIDIVIETEEMKKDYILNLGESYNYIVSNTNGIGDKRNFIRDYYQNKTDKMFILSIDDDLDDIMDYNISLSGKRFREIVELGFRECEKNFSCLFGISPFHNTFFLKRNVSTNLKYICGAFFGLVIERSYEPIHTDLDHYEDFLFTIEHYKRDGAVIRLNDIALKTKYFNPKGGITEHLGGVEARKIEQKNNAFIMKARYGKAVRIITKNYGYDLRLNHHFKLCC